ncbi:MAG TPA: glycosyltransferase family 2 protein [Casimicrobiaceae bacterium]|nr:glycosyltransferase family 2 protein [Casimicrobiaceae bacterium]
MTSKLRVAGISMIRNDADIVEAFVRHSVRLLDHLFVIVHSPEDGTGEILKALHGEGLPVTLIFDDEPAFLQGERLTWLAREAHAALPCDFIFPLDADEFLVPAERAAIDRALDAVPPGAPAARLRLRTFVPTADDDADEINPVRRIRHRLSEEPKVRKVVLTRTFFADPTLVLDHGSHGLLRVGASARQIPLPPLREIALAHYPVRSANQVTNKTVIGYLAHLATGRPELEERRIAIHWRRCYEDMVVNGATHGMTERQMIAWFHGRPDVEARAGEFVCDPTPADDALRYTHLMRNDTYATLARFAENLVRKRPGHLDGMRFDHVRPGPSGDGTAAGAGRRRS